MSQLSVVGSNSSILPKLAVGAGGIAIAVVCSFVQLCAVLCAIMFSYAQCCAQLCSVVRSVVRNCMQLCALLRESGNT